MAQLGSLIVSGAARFLNNIYGNLVGTINGYTVGKSVPSNAVFTDTDTKVTAVGNHYTPTGSSTISASGGAATNATGSGSAQQVVTGVTVDAKGHVTAVTSKGIYSTDTDTNTHRPIQVNGSEVLGNNTTALNLKAGSNVSVTNSSGTVTIAATDTKYESKAAASGGTAVSLVTTGEKATWNAKTSNTGTVTSVATGAGLTGGTITGSGTIKAKLKSETASTLDSTAMGSTANRQYAVGVDKSGYLSVNVPWTDSNTNTTYTLSQDSSDGHKITLTPSSGTATTITIPDNNTDTKNTAGSTDTSSKIFLIGATSQAANPQTYSHDTAYVGTDGCLYSGGTKVLTAHQSISGKANLASPAFTGTPTAPTAANGTNTTQIATTAFVMNAFQANDAMVFKGTIGSSGATVTALPNTHYQGWTYKVITAGTYAGKVCEIGDMIICVTDGTSANNDHWTVVQTNIDGAVTGPASSTDAHVATFNGTTGKVIKDSGFTIGKSVPSNAVFTDTDTKVTAVGNHYTPTGSSTISASGGTATNATGSGSAQQVVTGVTVDAKGHVTAVTSKGIYSTDTNTNTHRPIQVNGTEVLGNNTTALNLKAGSNVSLSNSSGTVTITATDTNTWRPVSDSVSSTSSSDAASSKAVKTAYDLANGKANASHTHNYAGSSSAGGAANLLAGTYSGNGGQLTPSAVSGGQVKAAMMNNPKGLSGFPTYCDTILMDTYTGNDVPWTTGLGIAKQDASPRMFIFNGAKGNTTTWKNITEVITAGNFSSQSLTKSQVTTALGYTPPTTDTNTHRPIQVNGTEVLGNNTTALNLKAGSNVSVTNSSGTVTISATDTNTWRSVSDAVNSTSSIVSASSKAVKTAYDLAASKTSNTGTVTKVTAGTGLTGGNITTTGTLAIDDSYFQELTSDEVEECFTSS